MILSDYLSRVRIELGDTDPTSERFSRDTLERACEKTVSMMSRFIPKREVVETTLTRTVSSENLVISSGIGTLANKPVKEDTLSISGYTRGTHYEINHLTGVVTSIGSSLPDNTYSVSYDLDTHMFDTSSLITNYIRIERVEYPLGSNPAFEQWGDMVILRSPILTHNTSLRLVYLTPWTPPTPDADGDYPSHMDNQVIIGASGQALIYHAEGKMHDITDILTNMTDIMDGIGDLTVPEFTATPPEAPELSEPTPPTPYTVIKPTSPTLPSVPTAPTAPTLDFTPFANSLAKVQAELSESAEWNADDFLHDGEELINKATRGANVGQIYGQYASIKVEMGKTYIAETQQRLQALATELNQYAAEVTSFGSEVNAYANSISGLIGKYREEINSETMGVTNSAAQVEIYKGEIQGQNLILQGFAEEVRIYQTFAQVFTAEMQGYSTQVQTFVQQAAQMAAQVSIYLDVAGRFLASGQSKVNEFLAAMGQRPEYRMTQASAEQR